MKNQTFDPFRLKSLLPVLALAGALCSPKFVCAADQLLVVKVSGAGLVLKDPNLQAYPHNSSVTLTAAPAAGWIFAGWAGDATGTNNALTMTMARDRYLTANFIQSSGVTNLVTNLLDNNSVGCLRWTIANSAPGDTVQFAPELVGTITLTNRINIPTNLTLIAPIPGNVVLSGNFTVGVLTVAGTVKLYGLVFARGAVNEGAFRNNGNLIVDTCRITNCSGLFPIFGGFGFLTMKDSTISGNSPSSAVAWVGGQAVFNNCTISDNGNITSGDAGGIANFGTLQMVNCTLSRNSALGGNGGALYNGGQLMLNSCTIASNSCSTSSGLGGGVYSSANLQILNTIVAYNRSYTNGQNIYLHPPSTFTSLGHNLIGVTNGSSGWTSSDLTGLAVTLGPLTNNGGSTFTHALLGTGIDAGDDAAVDNTFGKATDQRGQPRRSRAHVDIGAYESQGTVSGVASRLLLSGFANGEFGFFFTNISGATFTVLATTNLALPLSNWSVLGGVTETLIGGYQFGDPQSPDIPQRFYRVSSP